MNEHEGLTWSALEYEEKERSDDWFWALGIIVVTAALAAIIFENYFFAILVVVGGGLLAYFAVRKPEVIPYELNKDGLVIKNQLFPYENIKAFWIQADFSPIPKVKPLFFIHCERAFLPIISIPITLEIAEDIHNIMSTHDIAEVEMKEHVSAKIMDVLGF